MKRKGRGVKRGAKGRKGRKRRKEDDATGRDEKEKRGRYHTGTSFSTSSPVACCLQRLVGLPSNCYLKAVGLA